MSTTDPRLLPIADSQWDRARARHLLNRAAFGVPLAAIDDILTVGPSAAIDGLLDIPQGVDGNTRIDFVVPFEEYRGIQAQYQALQARQQSSDPLSEEAYQQALRDIQTEQNNLAGRERDGIRRLKITWMRLMASNPRPLQEKLALFWHGHFATSANIVQNAWANVHIYFVFRTFGTGSFKRLITTVGKSPAMLQYLNNNQNRKGHPNENWARELLELFSMGIGNYTEKDIREAARAFTGWTSYEDKFVFDRSQHDYGTKTFLGKTGNFDGDDIIDIICEQACVAEHIVRKMWEYFGYQEPDDALVDSLAQIYRDSDHDTATILRTIFRSREFYSDRAMGTQIKSPAQHLVQLVNHLELDVTALNDDQLNPLVFFMLIMGQDLLSPPNVKGWDGGRAWINTNTMLARFNYPALFINGEYDPGVHRPLRRVNAYFNPLQVFMGFEGERFGDVLDKLVDRFIGRPLEPDQRRVLVTAMAPIGEDDTFRIARTTDKKMRGLVHLLTATAEYQLC